MPSARQARGLHAPLEAGRLRPGQKNYVQLVSRFVWSMIRPSATQAEP